MSWVRTAVIMFWNHRDLAKPAKTRLNPQAACFFWLCHDLNHGRSGTWRPWRCATLDRYFRESRPPFPFAICAAWPPGVPCGKWGDPRRPPFAKSTHAGSHNPHRPYRPTPYRTTAPIDRRRYPVGPIAKRLSSRSPTLSFEIGCLNHCKYTQNGSAPTALSL